MAKSPPPPAQADEWLRPKDVQRYLKVSANRYYQLIKDNAFPVTKPDPEGRLVYVSKADVDAFVRRGYPAAQSV
ncbi:helix-turn-helix domain-containing protein [Fibrella sp. HMF5335]|uniref:Helix-turn-helix domain-containing protein n=1 Tax=Fibrella rubiginis TaxID=2817060 RepID=A0A939K3F5_9BACT|nr:helix-turn-helix domain-containing protein [Fibrella rubiginis]